MWIVAFLSGIVGLVVGRSIVAETSAHRRGLPDRWWNPECDECGGALTITMARCVAHGHRRRLASPLTPLITAGVFAAVALVVPSLWVVPAYLVFAAAMVVLTITDLDTKLIPNRILGPATVIASGILIVGGLVSGERWALVWAAVGAASYFAVMFLLALLARGGIGFGDVKLAFLIGVFTGYLSWGHVIVAGFGAFLIGGLVAVFLLITRRSGRKDAIPFGPFMTTAAIIAVVFGDAIITWYLR
ncbi:MAG: A24 family peptidase [Acidimicrobiia bacterium]|nr:MAG: A24 family peptidase [Acidimicrobiia bacterium]